MASFRLLTVLIPSALVLSTVVPTARADANSLNDNLGPREMAVGESSRADARGALSISLNPAGLVLSRELVFEATYGHRPGDGTNVVGVSACDSTNVAPGCFFYRYFKAAPSINDMSFERRAHEFGAVVSKRLSPNISLGVTSRYFDYNTDMAGEEEGSGFTVDVGTVITLQSFNIAVVGYNLFGDDSDQYPMGLGGGFSTRLAKTLGLSVDAVWNLDTAEGESTGRYGGGFEYFLQTQNRQNGYPLRGGVVYDSAVEGTYMTAGLGFISRKMGLDVGLRKQVSGGDELMIQASLRIFGPRMAAPAKRRRSRGF